MAVIRPLIIGFATTLKYMFKKPITVNYPEQKIPMFPKYRGKQVLMRDENGLEKCVACGLCAVACPADAIYLETADDLMKRHADVPLWLSVGDVASNDGEYFAPVAPLYWIKGNNEDFDVIAAAMAGRPPAPTLHYLPNGGPRQVGPWRVAALGGTFA